MMKDRGVEATSPPMTAVLCLRQLQFLNVNVVPIKHHGQS